MKLVYTSGVNKGKEVQVGDIVVRESGEVLIVNYFRQPHKPSSEGKVTVTNSVGGSSEFYVSVIGAEWIEREDRGETLEQIQQRYPGAILTDLDTAAEKITQQNITPPKEITKERFLEMLEVLPPEGWVNTGGTESFKLMEYTCGIVTQIFARVGTKYYEMQDKATLKHEEIIKKICG